MWRRFVLWWKIRRAEADLRFLRRVLREKPDDSSVKQLLPLVENGYQALRAEQLRRKWAKPLSFTCTFCHRENTTFDVPAVCRYCGQDAPPDANNTPPQDGATRDGQKGANLC
jgi:hypothetical protein